MNMHRLIYRPSAIGWDIVVSHLLVIQHWQAAPANVRLQSADIFDKIVSTAPWSVLEEPEDLQKRVQAQVLQALAQQGESHARSQASTDVDIRRAALDTLFKVLESQGHALVCGWTDVFNILRSACPPAAHHHSEAEQQQGSSSTAAKTSLLVRVAFPSLQLICSDFLAALSESELEVCITTLTEFGKQTDEVNVALTVSRVLRAAELNVRQD